MGEIRAEGSKAPPRVRLAKDIDFSKAKPNCKWCYGRGYTGFQTLTLEDGQKEKAAIICRCVSRNDGVKRDEFDKMKEKLTRTLEDGGFAQAMASDLMKIPADVREKALAKIQAKADDATADPRVRESCREAVAEVQRRLAEEKN